MIDVRRLLSLDLETYLTEEGILAPEIVCASLAWFTSLGDVDSSLLDREQGIVSAASFIEDEYRIITGANIAFDMGCLAVTGRDTMRAIFRAYEQARVFDVQVAQALDAIGWGDLYMEPERYGRLPPAVGPEVGVRHGGPLKGRYSLDRCVQFVLGRDNAKESDFWRKRYALLAGIPIDEWPAEARKYPIDDAVNTLEVATHQIVGPKHPYVFPSGGPGSDARTPGPHCNLDDMAAQAETAFDLRLGAIWGLRTDRARVQALRERTERAHAAFVKRFAELGFYKRGGGKDSSAVKRAVVLAYGGGAPCKSKTCRGGKMLSPNTGSPINCTSCSGTGLDTSLAPPTPAGGVSADRDTLLESGDPDLVAFGDSAAEKIRDTYLPFLESGVDRPISLKPNVLVASGRTSYDGLIQLLPREGGVRDCFRARPGYLYCSVDYAALELCTLAQVCYDLLGRSQMMETINATGDPGSLHTALAAAMAGCTPEEMTGRIKSSDPAVKAAAKKYRQAAKALNFGLPGGMGAAKLVFSKRKPSEGKTVCDDGFTYPGIRFCVLLLGHRRCGTEKVTEWNGRPTPAICRACVELVQSELRPAWFRQWPEIKPYFDWVTETKGADSDSTGTFPCLRAPRVRGQLGFTDGANNGFQAMAADGAKLALRKLTRECYLDEGSVLYGTRPIFFVHDEVFSEMPKRTAHLAAFRKADVMVSAMREVVRDVHIRAEPALMEYWYKEAEQAFNAAGELVAWEPKEKS